MELIDKLKAEGYDVQIHYERTTPSAVEWAIGRRERGDKLAQPPTQPMREFAGDPISNFGGKVTAVISLEGEEIARGVAVCSPVDNFSKSEGRIKALGRAVGVLRAAEFPRGA